MWAVCVLAAEFFDRADVFLFDDSLHRRLASAWREGNSESLHRLWASAAPLLS